MYKVVGFDGNCHNFNFTKNRSRKFRNNKSSYHLDARLLIQEIIPNKSLYEEVTLPGSKRSGRPSLLYADFFIPDLMLIIEVHGKQHYEYCSFFHKSVMDFYQSKQRDKDKIEWCVLNDINILILPYNEKNQWKTIIATYLKQ